MAIMVSFGEIVYLTPPAQNVLASKADFSCGCV